MSGAESSEQILYRGTTRGWPGSPELQEHQITCTTTDPYVATLFAIECRNHGQSIVLVASLGPFVHLPVAENWFAVIEAAVNVGVPPEEFARRALFNVEVDRAIAALNRLGFPRVPPRIPGKAALQDILEESHRAGIRLTGDQIAEFNRLIVEGMP